MNTQVKTKQMQNSFLMAVLTTAFAFIVMIALGVAAPMAQAQSATAENFNTHSGSDYKGINVGFNLSSLGTSTVTNVEVNLYNSDGDQIAQNTNTQDLLDLINDDGATVLSTPFITQEGTYTEAGDSFWNFGPHNFTESNRPDVAEIVVEFDNATTSTTTNDTLVEPNGVDYEDILPDLSQCEVVSTEIFSDDQTMAGTSTATTTFEHSAWTADDSSDFDGADWIWESFNVEDPEATTTVTFTRNFTYNGNTAISATFHIATDNSYSVELNGNAVGATSSGNNYELATYDTYDVSGDVQTGSNTLTIEVTNFGKEGETDPEANPAGLLYKLTIEGGECESDVDDDDDVTPPSNNGGGGGGGGATLSTRGDGDVAGDRDSNNGDNDGEVLGAHDSDDVPTDEELSAMLDDARVALLALLAQIRANVYVGFPNTGDGSISNSIFAQ